MSRRGRPDVSFVGKLMAGTLLIVFFVALRLIGSPHVNQPSSIDPSDAPSLNASATAIVGGAVPRVIADLIGAPTASVSSDLSGTSMTLGIELPDGLLVCTLLPAGGDERWAGADRPAIVAAFDCPNPDRLVLREGTNFDFSAAIAGSLFGIEQPAVVRDETIDGARRLSFEAGSAGVLTVVVRSAESGLSGAAGLR
jgi:hypothetical protein